jgi:hypothetical protein
MADKPYRYGPQDLYQYINGEAESFVAYGFVSLQGANYSLGSDNDGFITVDIYNMGERLNAFGVFQSKRGGEPSSVNIGAGSFGRDGYLAFYKNKYFVEILSFVKDEQWKTQDVVIARKVAAKIKGDIGPPRELSYFPMAGKIEGSERYVKEGILGHAFLGRGLICDYKIEGDVVSAFVAFFPSGKDAGSAFASHQDFLRRSGGACSPLNGLGVRGFVSQEPYHKNILLAQKGSFVIGVYDLAAAQKGMALLADILKRIEDPH